MPIVLPVLLLVVSFYLVLAPIIDKPAIEYLFSVLFILSGLLLYYPFVHRRVQWADRLMSKWNNNNI